MPFPEEQELICSMFVKVSLKTDSHSDEVDDELMYKWL